MGKAKNGMFGPFTGKVGNLVGYYFNGQYIIRSVPAKKSGKVGIPEKKNRKKLSVVQAWLKPICFFVRVGFKNYGSSTGGYHAAVSYILLNAVAGDYPDLYVDPAKVQVSGGDLGFPDQVSMVLEPGNLLRFNWTPGTDQGDDYDQAMLLAYDDHQQFISAKETAAFRLSGTDVLPLQSGKEDTTYHVYIGFVAQDRSRQSHSKYLGKVVIPAKASG
jgi:hypothetical protein